MKSIAVFVWALCATTAACAGGLERLAHFLRTARAGSAEFTQTVTSPVKAGALQEGVAGRVSGGHFAFQRPGQFKFVYTRPFAQTIVADGKNLWLYDKDLNQVTVQAQSGALGNTPAALLAAAADMQALHRDFELRDVEGPDAGNAQSLQWVQATPKDLESSLAQVRAGFDAQGQLGALEIEDRFGQRSHIRFGPMQAAPSLPDATFRFIPPEGADVLRP